MSAALETVTRPERKLAQVARNRGAGILHATRGKHKRLICMREGKVIFVASNVIEEQLEAFLVTRGLVDPAVMKSLEKEAAQQGQRAASLLLARRSLPPEKMYEAAVERIRYLLTSTMEWDDATYAFRVGTPKLDGELTIEMPFTRWMYDHAQRFPKAMPEVRKRIGGSEVRLLRSEEAKRVLPEIELSTAARDVLEMCDGFLGAAEVVSRVRGSTEAAWRAMHALLSVGVLRPVAAGEVPKVAIGETVSREEMLARLSRDDSTHYAVLGLGPKASTEEIRDAYYYLARRYHPDRHRVGEMRDLFEKIEDFFTKVTEAYNTLIDPDTREKYDEEHVDAPKTQASEPKQDTRELAQQNFARGMLLVKKKQLHDALKFLENATELDPSKAEYHLELGCVLALNPRGRDEAEAALRAAVDRNPAMWRAYLQLGGIYERVGRDEEAFEMFEEVLRWEPTNEEAISGKRRLASAKRKGLFGG